MSTEKRTSRVRNHSSVWSVGGVCFLLCESLHQLDDDTIGGLVSFSGSVGASVPPTNSCLEAISFFHSDFDLDLDLDLDLERNKEASDSQASGVSTDAGVSGGGGSEMTLERVLVADGKRDFLDGKRVDVEYPRSLFGTRREHFGGTGKGGDQETRKLTVAEEVDEGSGDGELDIAEEIAQIRC